MCDFRMWYQSGENVYVLQCVECNLFQIRIRNVAFMFDTNAYQEFCKTVMSLFNDAENNPGFIPVLLRVQEADISLVLSKNGLRELHLLLDGADTEMKAAQMAGFF